LLLLFVEGKNGDEGLEVLTGEGEDRDVQNPPLPKAGVIYTNRNAFPTRTTRDSNSRSRVQ